MNFAIFPMDKGEEHLGPYVAIVIEALKRNNIECNLGAMSTTIETDNIDQALNAVSIAHKALEPVANRIYTTITIDSQKGKENRIKSKVDSVTKEMEKRCTSK